MAYRHLSILLSPAINTSLMFYRKSAISKQLQALSTRLSRFSSYLHYCGSAMLICLVGGGEESAVSVMKSCYCAASSGHIYIYLFGFFKLEAHFSPRSLL